jgi:hypothetical protein
MVINFRKTPLSQPIKAQDSDSSHSFDFDNWVREVKPQLLAALQKRAGHSPDNYNE